MCWPDVIRITRPPSRPSCCAANSFTSRSAARTFSCSASSRCSAVRPSSGTWVLRVWLTTRMSTWSNASRAAPITAPGASGSAKSACRSSTRPPPLRSSASAVSGSADATSYSATSYGVQACTSTDAPAARSRRAVAKPMPARRPAPVTTAVRPISGRLGIPHTILTNSGHTFSAVGVRGTSQMRHFFALLGVVALLAGAAAAPSRGQTPGFCDASSYRLGLRSLTGTRGTGAQLVVRVRTPTPTCALPDTLDDVRATIGRRVVEYRAVAAPGGTTTVRLGRVKRLQRVTATVTFATQVTLNGAARTLLKPDLVLRTVIAPKSRLTAKPFVVVATLGQPTRDVAVTATVSVSVAGTVVGAATARVGPRRRAAVRVPVTLTALGRTPVSVTATADLPETSK